MTKRRYNIHVTASHLAGQQTVKGWLHAEPLVDFQRNGADYCSEGWFADFVRSLVDGSRKYLVLHNATAYSLTSLASVQASLTAEPSSGATISIPQAVMAESIFTSQLVHYADAEDAV